jgi:hypothetical protein
MDPEYLALGIMLAVLCTETERKKKKKRLWTRSWVARRGELGMSVLLTELEVMFNLHNN